MPKKNAQTSIWNGLKKSLASLGFLNKLQMQSYIYHTSWDVNKVYP